MYSVNWCHSIANHNVLLRCWWENQQVIAWKHVLAKFINDLSREEHHLSGHPSMTHPPPDWSLRVTPLSANPTTFSMCVSCRKFTGPKWNLCPGL
jgi:hypothetical protein